MTTPKQSGQNAQQSFSQSQQVVDKPETRSAASSVSSTSLSETAKKGIVQGEDAKKAKEKEDEKNGKSDRHKLMYENPQKPQLAPDSKSVQKPPAVAKREW